MIYFSQDRVADRHNNVREVLRGLHLQGGDAEIMTDVRGDAEIDVGGDAEITTDKIQYLKYNGLHFGSKKIWGGGAEILTTFSTEFDCCSSTISSFLVT